MIGDVFWKQKRKKHIGMTAFKNVVSNGKGKVVVL